MLRQKYRKHRRRFQSLSSKGLNPGHARSHLQCSHSKKKTSDERVIYLPGELEDQIKPTAARNENDEQLHRRSMTATSGEKTSSCRNLRSIGAGKSFFLAPLMDAGDKTSSYINLRSVDAGKSFSLLRSAHARKQENRAARNPKKYQSG
ncbi:hypothetical protein KSP39_PZI023212 [Platanthera zijinensis]|uniref:Uncharacterized protein n=1 Tax=Platanthera zijinensis TaxID=2320716 RepID=A0AAP0AW45_9ASPA